MFSRQWCVLPRDLATSWVGPFIVLSVLASGPSEAQTMAVLQGRALDTSASALPNATITVVNQSTGFSRAALTDGEDFELLFAISAADAVPVLDGWKSRFPGVRITCIGRVTEEPGVRLRDREGLREMPRHGYVHFA